MENTRIRVGAEAFSVGDEYTWLSQCDEDGAVVTFTGKVRNHNLGASVSALTLEHYPGMTEKSADGDYCRRTQPLVIAAGIGHPSGRATIPRR